MTRVDPQIEAAAAQRLTADEERITGQARRRETLSLRAAWRESASAPKPDAARFLVFCSSHVSGLRPGNVGGEPVEMSIKASQTYVSVVFSYTP